VIQIENLPPLSYAEKYAYTLQKVLDFNEYFGWWRYPTFLV